MHSVKRWLLAASAAAMLLTATVVITEAPSASEPQKRALKDHWRYFDGHWSYWYEPDQTWYYTDGTNWYYYNNDAWRPYRFDRRFGREAFERGEYKVPAADVRVTVPRHRIWVPPQ
jgi:hypothetical protein